MSHVNYLNACPGCLDQINKYPGFYFPLKNWFFLMRIKDPNFHISCAGRGKVDQEACFARGASNAHYGQSAHNYNVAIDAFFQIDGNYRLDENLFDNIVSGLDDRICWYGAASSEFKERPHFEWKNWRNLRDSGAVKLVE